MRLASIQTDLEWPDPLEAKNARAKLVLYLGDRFAELIEWAELKCEKKLVAGTKIRPT